MIARLVGTLVAKDPPRILVDVGGVGYEVEVPLSVLLELPPPGARVTLLTHHAVKEDSHALYGFLAPADRTLFRNLLKVSGVGAKLALTILSGASATELARFVATGDAAALTRLPGIGRKTAERLIMELRDKLDGLPVQGGMVMPSGGGDPVPADPAAEATAALLALGYKAAEVERMVRPAVAPGKSAEAIIREALKSQVSGR